MWVPEEFEKTAWGLKKFEKMAWGSKTFEVSIIVQSVLISLCALDFQQTFLRVFQAGSLTSRTPEVRDTTFITE